ncbi:MAG: hypothetical protein ACRD19_01485 [Terriglobia bacterium]
METCVLRRGIAYQAEQFGRRPSGCIRKTNAQLLRAAVQWVIFLLVCSSASAKTVIFWQAGFPTVESQPVTRDALNVVPKSP